MLSFIVLVTAIGGDSVAASPQSRDSSQIKANYWFCDCTSSTDKCTPCFHGPGEKPQKVLECPIGPLYTTEKNCSTLMNTKDVMFNQCLEPYRTDSSKCKRCRGKFGDVSLAKGGCRDKYLYESRGNCKSTEYTICSGYKRFDNCEAICPNDCEFKTKNSWYTAEDGICKMCTGQLCCDKRFVYKNNIDCMSANSKDSIVPVPPSHYTSHSDANYWFCDCTSRSGNCTPCFHGPGEKPQNGVIECPKGPLYSTEKNCATLTPTKDTKFNRCFEHNRPLSPLCGQCRGKFGDFSVSSGGCHDLYLYESKVNCTTTKFIICSGYKRFGICEAVCPDDCESKTKNSWYPTILGRCRMCSGKQCCDKRLVYKNNRDCIKGI